MASKPSDLLYATPYPTSGREVLFSGPADLIEAIRAIPLSEGLYRGKTEAAAKWAVTQALPKEGVVRRPVSPTLAASVLRAAQGRLKRVEYIEFEARFLQSLVGSSSDADAPRTSVPTRPWTRAWPEGPLARVDIYADQLLSLMASDIIRMSVRCLVFGFGEEHPRPVIVFHIGSKGSAEDLVVHLRSTLQAVFNATVPEPMRANEDESLRSLRWLMMSESRLFVRVATVPRSFPVALMVAQGLDGTVTYSSDARVDINECHSMERIYAAVPVVEHSPDAEDNEMPE